MSCQVIIDTDYILEVSKTINATSNEIASSINNLKKTCDDLDNSIKDQNIQNFKINFNDYLTRMNNLTSFYNSVSTTLNDLTKEYENIDQKDSQELKKIVDNDESNS